MAIVGNPVGENITKYNRATYVVTEEALREAFSKVKLPMPIIFNYQDNRVVGQVTEVYDATFNDMFSIGAKLELEHKFKYVSVGYRVELGDRDEDNHSNLDNLEITCFAAFDETGYDDVAEIQQLED